MAEGGIERAMSAAESIPRAESLYSSHSRISQRVKACPDSAAITVIILGRVRE
ncbi:hypothetical protein DPMN_039989 [Dreissena polymorpha]|uniref:Uncharacterized protein n=1 Tax=Dreissena polymorpha TaxID=45954 RepID=A0A9D4CV54_DREPO|nr:hypothetical protein DPMN_039989 [Dreissena polymorpha]